MLKKIYDSIWHPQSVIKFDMFILGSFVDEDYFDRTPENILLSININAHNIDIDFDEVVSKFNIKDDWKDFQKVLGLRDIESGEKLKIIKPPIKNPPNDLETKQEIEVPIEEVPIYPGCEKGDNDVKRLCTSDKIREFVAKEFNPDLVNDLGLEGKLRINVKYKIDKTGNIVDVRARAPHPMLEREAVRVIGMLPKMKPGTLDGKPVIVPFSLPIIFQIQ